jgi:hypothetical protein
VESYQYDASGAQTLQYIKETNPGSTIIHDATKSCPSVDDKLSVVNRHIGISAISNESFPGGTETRGM